jgi:hypothetical protein
MRKFSRNRGTIEELDYDRPVTHLFVTHVIRGITQDLESIVASRNIMANKLQKVQRFVGRLPDDVKIHVSKKPITRLLGTAQRVSFKPKGLWYDCDKAWTWWVGHNMPQWGRGMNYIYLVKINKGRMFNINSESELLKFHERFSTDDGEMVDWTAVAKHADGIEICPYQHSQRMSLDWYYGWDLASGCVWNPTWVRLSLVGVWDDDKGEVVPFEGQEITGGYDAGR